MTGFAQRLHRDEGGQAVVLIAVTLLGLIMMVGLAIDAGQLYVARRTAQEAADAGAYAGAVVHYQRLIAGNTIDTPAAIAAAYADAALNGFVDGVGNVTVVARVPTTGLYAGNTRYVEVIITEQVRTSIVPGGALTLVSVRAVAGTEPLNNQYAIMALDRSASGSQPALNVEQNGRVDLSGGGILVNSTRTPAADNNGTNNVTYSNCSTPCYTDVAGTVEGTWPNPRPGQPQEPDPFAGTNPPSIPACAKDGNTSCLFNSLPNGSTVTLDPGVYTVRIQYAGNTVIIMRPGVYILKAGIDLAGTSDAFTTDKSGTPPPPTASCVMSPTTDCGIFLYNTKTNYPTAGGTCGPINLQGNAAVKLSAPNSGDYKNFLVYQDPACTAEMKIGGNGVFEGNGTIYLPSAHFRFDGNNATLTGSQLVAKTVDIQTGNITIDFSAANTAQPILPRLSQ